MRNPLRVTLIAALVLLAGCGGTKTRTITAAAPAPAHTATTGTRSTPATTTTTGTSTSSSPSPGAGAGAGSGGTRAEAEATLKRQGFTASDPREYQPGHTLRVLIGIRTGSSDGYAQRAFFFVGGRYIGTDTADDSAQVRVEGQEDTTVTLGYRLYRKSDPLCCPSGGEQRVDYHWDGTRLVPQGPIPSSSAKAPLSRQ